MRAADYKELQLKMMDDAPAWCGTGCELREMPSEYFVAASERTETYGIPAPPPSSTL
jgi:hypothetical protein